MFTLTTLECNYSYSLIESRYDIKKCMKNVEEIDTLSYLAVRNAEIKKLMDYYNYVAEDHEKCSLRKW